MKRMDMNASLPLLHLLYAKSIMVIRAVDCCSIGLQPSRFNYKSFM